MRNLAWIRKDRNAIIRNAIELPEIRRTQRRDVCLGEPSPPAGQPANIA